MLGIDIARPLTLVEIRQLKAQGVGFVARYYSTPGNPKDLTHQEALAISREGLAIVSVFETTPTNAAYFTAAQGAQDGKLAIACTQISGQRGATIFAAVDYDAQAHDLPAIRQYLAAFAMQISPHFEAGVYGSHILASLGRPLWQAMAWSGGVVAAEARIVQALSNVRIAGVGPLDVDIALQPLHALGWRF